MDSVFPDYALRLGIALVFGGIIGIEREIRGKPAGMRTNMLMCLGSCLLMILSIEVARSAGSPADPGRIAAQVVTGVGFLGAGTIIRSRVSVAGLTTAATLWFVAALGLVIGYGDFRLAALATVLIILTLMPVRRLEKHLEVRKRLHVLQFKTHPKSQILKRFKAILADCRISPEDISLEREEDAVLINLEYIAPDAKHDALLQSIQHLEGVEVLLDY